MDIGICVPSHIGDTDYIVRAEELGYSHAWLADSQMIWSDCYATLALAAYRTNSIKLGTGVAITGTRPASVNAAGIATINALAPGRTFFGVTCIIAAGIYIYLREKIRDQYIATETPVRR